MNTVAERAMPPDTDVASASLELEAVLPSARQARSFTGESLCLWGEDEELVEAAVLIVCELTTNAIRHSAQQLPGRVRKRRAGSLITLTLTLRSDALHIEVRDGSSILPVQRVAGDQDDCGRGLAIITALAGSWTCGRDLDGGKWVRVSLPRTGPVG